MSRFFNWLKSWANDGNDQLSRDRHKLVPAVEVLEPRQMLAANNFLVFDVLETAEQVHWHVDESMVFASFWQDGGLVSGAESDASTDHDCREYVYLGELADEVGDLFEIEDQERWWLDPE